MNTDVLLAIDLQADFCPGGALPVPQGNEIIATVNRLAATQFDHVILTQDWHPAGHSSFASSHDGKKPGDVIKMPYGAQILWPDHCIEGTSGAGFHGGLVTGHKRAELIIRKGFRHEIDSYSAFYENDGTTPTGLDGYLRERGFERVFIVGLALDFCVRFSAEDAWKLGYSTIVIEDVCCGIDEKSIASTKESFADKGIRLINSDELGRYI